MLEIAPALFLIGVGNPLRRDDGIGWAVTERLATELDVRGVAVMWRCVHQLVPELAAEVAELKASALVIADAALNVDSPHVDRIEPGGASPGLGHALGAEEFVLWARELCFVSAPVWQIRLPAVDFEHGIGFSPQAGAALEVIPALADTLLSKLGHLPAYRRGNE
jgi:hydrogenase maturation protease